MNMWVRSVATIDFVLIAGSIAAAHAGQEVLSATGDSQHSLARFLQWAPSEYWTRWRNHTVTITSSSSLRTHARSNTEDNTMNSIGPKAQGKSIERALLTGSLLRRC